MNHADDPRVRLLSELAHPLRLRVVDRLGQAGAASATRLAGELGVAPHHLSNHLRRLREAGLVAVERSGRRSVYRLADPGLARLLPLLDHVTGRVAAAGPPADTEFARARTCYDHLAGGLGVALYAALRERGAVRALPDGSVELGARAAETFERLGVAPERVSAGRRRFAVECLDATEHAPHLAGALGAALAEALTAKGWIARRAGGRAVRVTRRGASGLRDALTIDVS